MTKTAKQIVSDVMNLLKGSPLVESITGKVYRSGCRPEGSKKEDLVVIFTTGDPSQMQRGVVTINIYTRDVQSDKNYVEDGSRCEAIEILAQQWIDSLNKGGSPYYFTLQQTIYTEAEKEINQHFVVVKLKYKLLTD